MRTIAAGAAYFGMVFLVAFALGTIRTLWFEPAIGETFAVACEAPLLITAMVFAARTLPRILIFDRSAPALFAVGVIGLALQQMAEFGLVLAAGETPSQHLAYLQTPAGMIYLFALLWFVAMPLLVLRVERQGR